MNKVNFSKVVNTLPATLEPNTIYFVKNGSGVLAYVTNGVGEIIPYGITVSLQTLGLENVDNTSDMDKPVSTATQLELNDRYTKSETDQIFITSEQVSDSAEAALTSEQNAANSEQLAERWANEAEDIEVETGKYSALHWAEKASASAASITPTEGPTPSTVVQRTEDGKVRVTFGDAGDEAVAFEQFDGKMGFIDAQTSPTDSTEGRGLLVGAQGNALGANVWQTSNLSDPAQLGQSQTFTANQTINADLNVTGSKNFRIDNPANPDEYLYHSAIESDKPRTQYVLEIDVDTTLEATHTMPDWFHGLNGNTCTVFCSPCKHFGQAYGEVLDGVLTITANQSGKYHVLIMAERIDPNVVDWRLTELKPVEDEVENTSESQGSELPRD